MTNQHFEERCVERYNIELSEGNIKMLVNTIKRGDYLYIRQSKEDKHRHFAYVVMNHIPIKVLYYKSNKRTIRIITAYPFDPDEYNSLLETKKQNKINKAITLLKEEGYIVYRRKNNGNKRS